MFEPEREHYTGRFLMLFVITNVYNKKTKGTLMELFTVTGKLKKFYYYFF